MLDTHSVSGFQEFKGLNDSLLKLLALLKRSFPSIKYPNDSETRWATTIVGTELNYAHPSLN